MTSYVATVGNDPAPVALGYLAACQYATIEEARLIFDAPRSVLEEQRQQALIRWLEGHGVTVKTDEALTAPTQMQAAFNLTGGNKMSVLPLLQRAQATGSLAFVVDAHGQELLIHDLLSAHSEPATQHLSVQDYLQLYLPPQLQEQALMQVQGFTELPSSVALALALPQSTQAAECWVTTPHIGNKAWNIRHVAMWWVVRRSHLFLVWDVRELSSEKLRERLRWLSKKTRDLGGQLATAGFWLTEGSPEVLDWIKDDLKAQVVLSSAATSVYVALLGAQPMPPLIGLQTHQDISQVYLLATPQVYDTGQRLKNVLEARPQWQGEVHILEVEAAHPISIRQQLDFIHARHPEAFISINLTGGTKALALHAELWAQGLPFAQTEYTLGQQVHRLQQQFAPQWHLSLQEELALRGVQLAQIRPLPPFHPELLQAAAFCFEEGVEKEEAREMFAAALKAHLPELLPSKRKYAGLPGLAGEYLGIVSLARELAGLAREVVWATKLNFASGTVREIDGLALLNNGHLLVLEVKRDLIKGIEAETENDQTPALAERLAGLYAHSLLLGRVSEHQTSERWEQALRQSGPLKGTYSLWAIGSGGKVLPQGVRRFPEDLHDFLK